MKNLLFLIAASCGLLLACKHARRDQQTVEWKCGEGALSITKTFPKDHSGELTLTLDKHSLCQSNGIKVLIASAEQTVFLDTIVKFPFAQTWKTDRKDSITVTTDVVGVPSNIRCIRLGEVTCTVKY
jgi:hypothetical protein